MFQYKKKPTSLLALPLLVSTFHKEMMAKDTISAMTCLILALSMTTPVTPAYLLHVCNPHNLITSTRFQHNLNTLLDSLPSNTSKASGYFHTAIEDDPDKVYGQALCRGDVDSTTCQRCLQNAAQQLKKDCKGREDALTWFELCQIHYSYRKFISMNEYNGKRPTQNKQKKRVANPDKFGGEWKYLMHKLSEEAASNGSKSMFATGELHASDKVTTYGLVQCTRDISTSDCKKCLNSGLGDLEGCCSANEGGTILSANCITRFELFRFFNGSTSRLFRYQGFDIRDTITIYS